MGLMSSAISCPGAVSERVPQETETGKVGGSPGHCVRVRLRYRISSESYSKIMALLLFGGPYSSQGYWFGLRSGWLLFHLCCRTLRTFATEADGKLAAIIRVNLGVVLGS